MEGASDSSAVAAAGPAHLDRQHAAGLSVGEDDEESSRFHSFVAEAKEVVRLVHQLAEATAQDYSTVMPSVSRIREIVLLPPPPEI
jgi:hypothetical protein